MGPDMSNTIDHREMAWCCKENLKTNPPRLEIKKGEPCPHTFKYINCKEEHQVDSNTCLFWKNCFNKNWYGKKQQMLYESRVTSICSVM